MVTISLSVTVWLQFAMPHATSSSKWCDATLPNYFPPVDVVLDAAFAVLLTPKYPLPVREPGLLSNTVLFETT